MKEDRSTTSIEVKHFMPVLQYRLLITFYFTENHMLKSTKDNVDVDMDQDCYHDEYLYI